MKTAILVLTILCATAAHAQMPGVYECVRPDGTVICTVRDTSGAPSVTCNHECVDCNMVCVARMKLTHDDGKNIPVVPLPVGGERLQPASGVVETREYCRQTFQQCIAKCKSDPMNKKKYDVDACISSCNSWFSGCGMTPKE